MPTKSTKMQQSKPIRVVVIHGDPNKPNDILPGGRWDQDDFESIAKAKEALDTLDSYTFTWLSNHDTLMSDLMRLKRNDEIDLVLQLCDEGWMNHSRMELHIAAFLEMLDVAYTGVGPKTIGITYDKQVVLKLAESIGIPVPKSVMINEGDAFDPIPLGLEYPIIVKPNSTDGSFGITAKNVCYRLEEVEVAIEQIRNVFYITGPLLIQEFLTGRDVNAGVMERVVAGGGANDGGVVDASMAKKEIWVLPITEEDYSKVPEELPKICGFESKWDESSPYFQIITRPTTLSASIQCKIGEMTKLLFSRLECHDYARFDWRLDAHGNPRFLEANPNCGWCWDGHLPKTAALSGVSYARFFDMIMQSALFRAKERQCQKEVDKLKKFVNVGSSFNSK